MTRRMPDTRTKHLDKRPHHASLRPNLCPALSRPTTSYCIFWSALRSMHPFLVASRQLLTITTVKLHRLRFLSHRIQLYHFRIFFHYTSPTWLRGPNIICVDRAEWRIRKGKRGR